MMFAQSHFRHTNITAQTNSWLNENAVETALSMILSNWDGVHSVEYNGNSAMIDDILCILNESSNYRCGPLRTKKSLSFFNEQNWVHIWKKLRKLRNISLSVLNTAYTQLNRINSIRFQTQLPFWMYLIQLAFGYFPIDQCARIISPNAILLLFLYNNQ